HYETAPIVLSERVGLSLMHFSNRAGKERIPDWLHQPPGRFKAVSMPGPVAACDSFGQVAVFDPKGTLVVIFFVYQNHLAAWMPDGTRYGPAHLTGSLPTPDAAERIGRALWSVSQQHRQNPNYHAR